MKSGLPIVLAFFALATCAKLQAQVINATQTDEIIIDNGASGKADPNDRIRYKVTIQNTGGASGNGVQLNAVPDPRTTFVPGTFRSSPLAVNDTYTCTGNVGINVPAASGVKSNDFDDNLAIATLSVTTPPTNGTVALNNDGSFNYSPNAGFTGTETFTYTLTDGNPVGLPVPLTDVATVTITVSNVIWFVDNSVAGPGTGTVIDPLKSLTTAGTASSAGHVIFFKANGTTASGGITLKNNQYLLGTGHTGGSNLADPGVLPFSLAPHSKPLPAINGVAPTIANLAGGGNGITLASGNTIRGVNVGRCEGTKIFGTAFGTLTIGNTTSPDVALVGNKNALNLTNGAFAATSKFSSINCPDSSNLTLNTVSGSLASGSTTIGGASGTGGISIQNSSATLDFGPTNASALGGVAGVSITNSGTGSVSFSSLVVNASAAGLFASNGGTINIAGTGNTATGRPAIDLTSTSLGAGATFASITSINSGTTGVNLDAVTGALTINGGSITNATGNAFDVNAGTGAISYAGTITNSSSRSVEVTGRTGSSVTFSGNITDTGASTGINVANNSGGTVTFSGAGKSLTTGANTAVTLATNTGATINFSNGGLAISTTSGMGFNATGGGTISVTGSNNTIVSTTGTALNVANTTISNSNLNFRSISANGAANGIVLSATGSSGGLTVTGTGGAGTGGTIQNITNRGVSAVNTINLSLSNMNFTNANTTDGAPCGAANNTGCNAAIHMGTVTNATLSNVNVNGTAQQGVNLNEVNGFQFLNSTIINAGAGGQTEEACLYALNLFGTCAITGSSLTVPAERAAVIYNTSKTLGLTVTGSTFGMNQTQPLGADALEISSFGASNTTIDITSSTFVQPKTNGLQVITENTSVTRLDLQSSTFDPGTGLAAAIDLVTNNTGHIDFNIIGNPSIKAKGINVVNVFANPSSTFHGRINNNTIVHNGGSGAGVRVFANGNGNSRIEIKDNNITAADDYGITVNSQAGTGRLDATITGNTVSISPSGFYVIHALAGNTGSTFSNKVCANVANNTTTAPAGSIGNFQARSSTALHEILLQGGGGSVLANWNANSNLPVAPPAVISQSGSGIFTFGATCLLPTHPLP